MKRQSGVKRLIGVGVGPGDPELVTVKAVRVLREAGVVRQVYRGTAKMNDLRRDDLDTLFPGLIDSVLDAAARQAARTATG